MYESGFETCLVDRDIMVCMSRVVGLGSWGVLLSRFQVRFSLVPILRASPYKTLLWFRTGPRKWTVRLILSD
ncbi:hypothetical protein MTR_6g012680 [Medicago truncatula]|uniref:Uncharacterized protein n=1 Tax=Medicago truncatula TaxID=3880 RepID=G7KKX6_MEDTR|nr:hypothetical protein MTR_6g012680 [Medicago truncatula]